MKKIKYIIVVVLLFVSVCLCSCKDNGETLRKIEIMLRQDYEVIRVNVDTSKDDITLNGEYVFTRSGEDKIEIEYSYEQLANFDVDDGVITSPSEFKETRVGTAVVENGQIVSIDGDNIEPETLTNLLFSSITLRNSFFKNVKISDYTFKADVVNAKGFLNKPDFEGTNMKVEFGFRKSLDRIEIRYDLSGAQVTLTYKFTK